MKSYEGTEAYQAGVEWGYRDGWGEGYEAGFTDGAYGGHKEWHFCNDDPYDESDAPTEEGWYRIITDKGQEMTDYFFARPVMREIGAAYWKNCEDVIKAWAKIKE